MFTEDYLMRIINQVLAALMTAIGLRKAGKYSEARQAVEQAIEQLTVLPANVIDLMEDAALLSMLTFNGQLEVDRLATLADLYQEQGEILFGMGQPVQSSVAFARALRFNLEVALFDDANLSTENTGKIEGLVQRLIDRALPFDTQLALSDYYLRLLEKDDRFLAAAGLSRDQVSRIQADLQNQINSSSTGD
jgi:tetratricopeptide (TPR) repeat protein